MEFTGSSYEGDRINCRMEGKGTFTFADGSKYVGDMVDGQFHGHGVLHFPNGSRFEADWVNGKAVGPQPAKGQLTFKDGLVYEEGDWGYCDEDDRRFYSEHVHGIRPAGRSQLVDGDNPPAIPPGTYDCGDGYYDPTTRHVCSYQGDVLREPDEKEVAWIIKTCRVG